MRPLWKKVPGIKEVREERLLIVVNQDLRRRTHKDGETRLQKKESRSTVD
jgi:hypothetical protein